MPKTLDLEFRVHMKGNHPNHVSNFEVTRWLPDKDESEIQKILDDCRISVYFDKNCVSYPDELISEEQTDVSRFANIGIKCLVFEVRLKIEDDLADHILSIDPSKGPGNDPLDKRYTDLGISITEKVNQIFNHIVSYLRTEKNQYWLEFAIAKETPVGPSPYDGKARIEGGDWFHWRPTTYYPTITTTMLRERDYVSSGDWEKIRSLVGREQWLRPWPVEQLLVDARQLRDQGFYRSALVEACVALERALDRFVENPLDSTLYSEDLASRINLSSLKSVSQKLGLKGSINLLLPMIIPRQILKDETVTQVQQAVDERNEIVHQGKINIKDENKINQYINSIITMCRVLRKLTKSNKYFESNKT